MNLDDIVELLWGMLVLFGVGCLVLWILAIFGLIP